MNPYCHLTINEREIIFLLHEQGKSLGYISKQLNRAKSTISRELKRNTIQEK
ncbi:helix-turn-helix domain-containing protein, partial [Aerococcus viridans]